MNGKENTFKKIIIFNTEVHDKSVYVRCIRHYLPSHFFSSVYVQGTLVSDGFHCTRAVLLYICGISGVPGRFGTP